MCLSVCVFLTRVYVYMYTCVFMYTHIKYITINTKYIKGH